MRAWRGAEMPGEEGLVWPANSVVLMSFPSEHGAEAFDCKVGFRRRFGGPFRSDIAGGCWSHGCRLLSRRRRRRKRSTL